MYYSRKDIVTDILFIGTVLLMLVGAYFGVKWAIHEIKTRISTNTPARSELPAVGSAFNDQWSIQTLDGEQIPLSRFKGKVIFLNFWATWCTPCRMELPSIERLYERFREKGVVFLCVSQEDAESLKAFAKKKSLQLPLFRVQDIPRDLRVNALPTTFIIDPQGKIAEAESGARNWDRKKIVQRVDSILQNEKAPAQ